MDRYFTHYLTKKKKKRFHKELLSRIVTHRPHTHTYKDPFGEKYRFINTIFRTITLKVSLGEPLKVL